MATVPRAPLQPIIYVEWFHRHVIEKNLQEAPPNNISERIHMDRIWIFRWDRRHRLLEIIRFLSRLLSEHRSTQNRIHPSIRDSEMLLVSFWAENWLKMDNFHCLPLIDKWSIRLNIVAMALKIRYFSAFSSEKLEFFIENFVKTLKNPSETALISFSSSRRFEWV